MKNANKKKINLLNLFRNCILYIVFHFLLKIDSYTTLQINYSLINNASQFIKNSYVRAFIGLYKNYTTKQFLGASFKLINY